MINKLFYLLLFQNLFYEKIFRGNYFWELLILISINFLKKIKSKASQRKISQKKVSLHLLLSKFLSISIKLFLPQNRKNSYEIWKFPKKPQQFREFCHVHYMWIFESILNEHFSAMKVLHVKVFLTRNFKVFKAFWWVDWRENFSIEEICRKPT